MSTSPNAVTPCERSEFLQQVGDLVRQAEELGLSAVLADAPRRRKPGLAIDLQFFRSDADGRLRHGGNPILTWNASNVRARPGDAGERKLTKAKSIGRIDGIVALTMALHAAVSAGEVNIEAMIV